MIYVDTSLLVAYYCPEPLSEKAESLIISHTCPAISNLTEVEFYSAISRKIRMEEMNRRDGSRIIAKFLAHINDHFYTNILIKSHHYVLARDWLGQFNTSLRSLDAIHLAVASSEGLMIITADETLSKSAKIFGIDTTIVK